jgi:hypothetical protein
MRGHIFDKSRSGSALGPGLALALGLLLTPLGCAPPPGPDLPTAQKSAGIALADELAEPYAFLALKLATKPNDNAPLTELARRLFQIDELNVDDLHATPEGPWVAKIHARISCALPADAPELDTRDALAIGMGYRSQCPHGSATPNWIMDRSMILEQRGGIWVAQLDTSRVQTP